MRLRLTLLGLAIVVALAGCASPRAGGDTSTSAVGPPAAGDPAAEQRAIAAANLPECPAVSGGRGPAAGGPAADAGGGSASLLPEITLDCLGAGPAVTLSGLPAVAGRPLLINVWASWCLPCAAEMPRLIRAADAYAGRVDILGLDILDDRVSALDWAAQIGVNFPSLYDHDGAVRTELPIPGPPVTFFVSGDGGLVHTEYGEIDSDARLTALIDEHLGVAR